MNRKLIALIVGIMWCSGNFVTSANESNSVLWGLKATVNAELPGKWRGKNNSVKMFNPGSGFTVGGVSNIYLGNNFYIEPGVSFFYSQYRYDLIVGGIGVSEIKNPRLSKLGIEIPVVFGYTFDINNSFAISVFTGPQIRYALGGSVGVSEANPEDDYESLLKWDTYRRFDCSWKIGIGFPINNFMLSVEADLGMNNLIKSSQIAGQSTMSFRENRIGVGLAYYF